MNNYVRKKRISTYIIILCILSIVSIGIYQLYIRNNVREYVNEFENQNISNMTISIDRYFDKAIDVDQKIIIDDFKKHITNFKWSISHQKFFMNDGNTVYDFEISGERGSSHISLIGKKYVLINYYDQKNNEHKNLNLEVTWDVDSYEAIVSLVNKSRELDREK